MRKVLQLLFIFQLLVSLLFGNYPVFADAPYSGGKNTEERIIVKFKSGLSPQIVSDAPVPSGATKVKYINQLNVQVLKVPAGQMVSHLQAYRQNQNVEYVEPDYIIRVTDIPNDTYFGEQWGLTKIKAPDAWSVTSGNASVKVAVLDTGIDLDHPDLASKIVASLNLSASPTVDDLYGHGTHVAGIIAAVTNNGIGVAGVGFNTSLLNVKVMDDTGSGFDSDLASGIIWAADNGARVINMSLGGADPSSTLENAINYAWNKGVVLVASAGNSGSNFKNYPAFYTNCIAVAAIDQDDQKPAFSTYGDWVDVAAPGISILSTLPNHPNYVQQKYGMSLNYGLLTGTSMAAPFTAGLTALIWATPWGKSAAEVRARLENTSDMVPGTGVYWQKGRINAYRAVSQSGNLVFSNLPGFVKAGEATTFFLTANDNLGAPIRDYRGTIHFSSIDSLAVLPADYNFNGTENGTCQFSAVFNTAGIQSIRAADLVDSGMTASQSNLQVKAVSSTTLTSSVNPSVQGQSITLVASVLSLTPGTGLPSGLVKFRYGSTEMASVLLNASGKAVLMTIQLPSGMQNVTAFFEGGPGFSASSSSVLAQNVWIRGDAVGDGVVDMGDIVKLERIILGLDLPTPGSDANLDGSVNMADAVEIERLILGLPSLPKP